jgi:hypothetical protein
MDAEDQGHDIIKDPILVEVIECHLNATDKKAQ